MEDQKTEGAAAAEPSELTTLPSTDFGEVVLEFDFDIPDDMPRQNAVPGSEQFADLSMRTSVVVTKDGETR